MNDDFVLESMNMLRISASRGHNSRSAANDDDVMVMGGQSTIVFVARQWLPFSSLGLLGVPCWLYEI